MRLEFLGTVAVVFRLALALALAVTGSSFSQCPSQRLDHNPLPLLFFFLSYLFESPASLSQSSLVRSDC